MKLRREDGKRKQCSAKRQEEEKSESCHKNTKEVNMANWKFHVEQLQRGETVSFRPKGNSMQPKIESGNLVTISPSDDISDGDIVFCKVKGNYYIHLVKAKKVEGDKESYLIGNNKGGTNGWAGKGAIFGKVTKIES